MSRLLIKCARVAAFAFCGLVGTSFAADRMGDACDVTLSPALKFDEKTCPMCFLHGDAEGSYTWLDRL